MNAERGVRNGHGGDAGGRLVAHGLRARRRAGFVGGRSRAMKSEREPVRLSSGPKPMRRFLG
jgi:hypothetical protein